MVTECSLYYNEGLGLFLGFLLKVTESVVYGVLEEVSVFSNGQWNF